MDLPRTALITGSGRGIGRAIAIRLSAAGHRVGLTARNAAELGETAAQCPGPSLVAPADLTQDGAVDSVFAAVESTFGPVEILVANAGAGTSAPLHRVTDADWQRMIDLNLDRAISVPPPSGAGDDEGRVRAHRRHRVGGVQTG